ncbi:helix-turn-helix transcriptional regulator [Ideonella azotifigens]|uniref:AraC family transcriptional regulator n=1 Tax=Ideonella azotifigens TaxID=513160 RepID=A0ABN1KL55_9BURK|nr:helix-turn-helix transcriptional regulator [Ideonella azotifigens]MCD2339226.1 helix-turn-helix transcriptional regulator [Ideonella azotifigens]
MINAKPRGGASAAPKPSPGQCAHVTAVACHRVSTLTMRDDAVVVVKQGRKTLLAAGAESVVAERGDGMLVARGTHWDVINDPAGHGRYESLALFFGDELVREHQAQATPTGAAVPAAQLLVVDEELREAMQRAASFLQAKAVSVAVQRHRLLEVLLLLAERGHHFRAVDELGWDERVRRLVAQRPHADWSVDAVASAFHMSASTLRRRLSETEGDPSLAALVREVRLETALGLLQTTKLPIGEIAQRCGWESHSRFSAMFQERWGFVPSVLRAGMTQSAQRMAQGG